MRPCGCGCGCGRAWRPLNPRAQYHPLCRAAVNKARLLRHLAETRRVALDAPEDAAQIEAMFQAARTARKAA